MTREKLEYLKERLRLEWEQDLKNQGVEFPSGRQLEALACLREAYPNQLSQDEITQMLSEIGIAYNKQVRHLTDKGWYITSGNSRFTRGVYEEQLGRNEVRLFSLTEPNPVWDRHSAKRIQLLGVEDWEEVLEIFNHRGCAVCGIKTENNKYDKGHLDRKKPYHISNIVPMCSNCNNWGQAKDVDFELDRFLVARPRI